MNKTKIIWIFFIAMCSFSVAYAQENYDESGAKQIKDKREVALNEARNAYNALKTASEARADDRITRSIKDYDKTAMGWKADVEREKVRRMAIMDESYEKEISAKKYEAEKARIEKEYKDAMAKEDTKKKASESAALERRRQQAIEKLKNDQAFKKQQEELRAREKALAEDEKRLAEQRKRAAEIARKEAELKEREDKLRAEKERLAKEYDPQAAAEARKKRDEEIQKEVDRRNEELRKKQPEEARWKEDELAGEKTRKPDLSKKQPEGAETTTEEGMPPQEDTKAYSDEIIRLGSIYRSMYDSTSDFYAQKRILDEWLAKIAEVKRRYKNVVDYYHLQ